MRAQIAVSRALQGIYFREPRKAVDDGEHGENNRSL